MGENAAGSGTVDGSDTDLFAHDSSTGSLAGPGAAVANPTTNEKDGNSDSAAEAASLAWQRTKDILKQELDSQRFQAYIEPLELIDFDSAATLATLACTSRLVANHVQDNLIDRIRSILVAELDNREIKLRCVHRQAAVSATDDTDDRRRPATAFIVKRVRVTPENADKPAPLREPATTPANVVDSSDSATINSRYTFGDFVVGNSNQFCHAAAMRVAENPGQNYNPLFIYGGVGLGKTHLLHAIGNAVLARNASAKVLYLSSETFTNELILALRHAKMEDFKKRMRAIEVLLIDDVQFICGKERTQEEFFHTFNALYSAKRQIVITSDKIPTDIPGIEERLQTRFSWGLTADLQAPDFETRVAILNQKAIAERFALPEEVSHLIAERVSSNVRELEGALTRLHAVSSFQNIPITIDLARTALKHLLQPKVVNLSVDDIKKAVANHFGIKVSEIMSKRRTKNLSFPRHIAMYLCRKHTTYSYPEIGEHFGGRDHSSVIHAANVVASKVSADPSIKAIVEDLERSLLG